MITRPRVEVEERLSLAAGLLRVALRREPTRSEVYALLSSDDADSLADDATEEAPGARRVQ